MHKTTTTILKWGVLLGIALSVLELIKSYARKLDFPNYSAIFSILLLLILIGSLYMAIKEVRSREENEHITYPKAFGVGTGTVGIAFVVVFAYLMLQYSVIAPKGLDEINDNNLAHFHQLLEKDSITTSELQTYLSVVDSLIQKNKQILINDEIADSLSLSAIDSATFLIDDFYTMFVTHHKAVDSTQFLLGNFDDFSKNTLISAMEKMTNQNCINPQIKPFIYTLYINTSNELVQYSPLERRFSSEKDTISLHTNVLSASLVFALSVILYGLLCNLFVSLFLYRSKKDFQEIDETENNENQDIINTLNNDKSDDLH